MVEAEKENVLFFIKEIKEQASLLEQYADGELDFYEHIRNIESLCHMIREVYR